MSFTRKTLAIVVALAIMLTSISIAVFADPTGEATVTTSFKVLKDGATDLTNESNWVASEYAKRGSTVRGDVYLTTDFVAGSITLELAYDDSAIEVDTSKHTQIEAGKWSLITPSSLGLSGTFVDGTSNATYCVTNGYADSSDMEGKGFIFIRLTQYVTHKYNDTLCFSFYFKVKEDATPYTLENSFGMFPDSTMTFDHYDAPSDISYIVDQTRENVSYLEIGRGQSLAACDYELTINDEPGSIKIGGVIKLDPQGGKWSDDSTAVKDEGGFYKEAIGEVPTAPTRAGYTFEGWSSAASETEKQVVNGKTYVGGDQSAILTEAQIKALTFEQGNDISTLYAVWAVQQYTITFVNEDNTVLQQSKWDVGATPSYTGAAPEKVNPAAGKTYKWNEEDGWTETIAEVTGDKTYTAKFTEEDQKFTITFVDEDGTELQTINNVPYGTVPVFSSNAPSKTNTDEYTYSWNPEDGWTEPIVAATADKTYTAKYTATKNKYDVKFEDAEGNIIGEVQNIEYGSTPTVPEVVPTKPSSDGKDYVFAGWSPDPTQGITGETVYTPTFTEKGQVFTITFKNEDGTVLQTLTNVAYGTTPAYTGDTPTKAETEDYIYTFSGWSPEITAVTGDAIYTATYNSTYKPKSVKDTFSYIDSKDNSVIGEPIVKSGTEGETYEVPEVNIPEGYEKSRNVNYLDGIPTWGSDGVFGSEDRNFSILLDRKSYNITFVDENGEEISTEPVEYKGEIPEAPEVPNEITAEDGTVMIFDGWEASDGTSQPGDAMPSHEVTFTPKYKEKTYDFIVTYYKDEDHTEVYSNSSVKAGDPIPEPDNGEPKKFGYKFIGWKGTDDLTVGDTMPEKDIELTAQWELDKGLIAAAVGGAVIAGAAGTIAAANTALITGGAIVGGAALIGGGIYLSNNTHRVVYMVDGEVYRTFFVIDGTKVIVPSDPSKDGYTFAGWDNEIPDRMPNHDLTFNAKFVAGENAEVPATGSATAGLSALAIISAATAAAYVISTRKKEED